MVSTLRIASVVAVVVAGLFLASVTGLASLRALDAGRDEELQSILDAPRVVTKFQESQGDKAQDRQDAISPLVREAEAFALYLDPPAPPKGRTETPNIARTPRHLPGPQTTTAKFDLLGTCYSAASQSECFAYIQMQDGKTYRWVRTGDEIGYMTVKEIRRDSIVCWDGNGDVPMFVPQRQDTSSLLETGISAVTATRQGVPPSATDRITGSSLMRPTLSSASLASQAGARPPATTAPSEEATLNRLVDRLRDSAGQSEEKKAAVNRIMEEFREARQRSAEVREVPTFGNEPNSSAHVSPLQGRPSLRRRLGTVR